MDKNINKLLEEIKAIDQAVYETLESIFETFVDTGRCGYEFLFNKETILEIMLGKMKKGIDHIEAFAEIIKDKSFDSSFNGDVYAVLPVHEHSRRAEIRVGKLTVSYLYPNNYYILTEKFGTVVHATTNEKFVFAKLENAKVLQYYIDCYRYSTLNKLGYGIFLEHNN